MPCPCGVGLLLSDCCGPLLAGAAEAATAEQLMRSRYSAFAVGDAAYLLSTWAPSTRPRTIDFDAASEWTRLEIVGRTGGGPFDTDGTVEFRAHYLVRGEAGVQRENSRFVRQDGHWVYLDSI